MIYVFLLFTFYLNKLHNSINRPSYIIQGTSILTLNSCSGSRKPKWASFRADKSMKKNLKITKNWKKDVN